jgi:hypothetical protein
VNELGLVFFTVDHTIANVVEIGQMTNIPKGCQQCGFELRYASTSSPKAHLYLTSFIQFPA